MDMYEAINTQNVQLAFEPEIEYSNRLHTYEKFVIAGMGGSHLAADILKCWNPLLDIIVHEDYGLPPIKPEHISRRLFVASSHSGNTEEVLDGFEAALARNMPVCAISTGGKLLDRAEQEKIPYIKIPDTGIQPRSALGYSLKSFLKIMGVQHMSDELLGVADTLSPGAYEHAGKKLAAHLHGYVPLVYASTRNRAIAYNWKIKCNETGKIPSFINVLPELNHNEMTGFDVTESTASLSRNFSVIILRDEEDHPAILKRMEILAKLYHDRGIKTEIVAIEGASRFERIFSSLILADWTAYYISKSYGTDPNEVPMVEEFKKLMK
ncbi:MAG: bifunctional phosphoglucose/phosphomannose isomerase [Candidatus Sungbacteria bacterium]|nr:bifunctional phosphoglucose/phosphomannose isomerase [bacterium]MDZ4286150.1 bifunctional phosphoglucose/phosphomannose isomerase [Candidatus Sungbacteria bacterium]